MIRLYVLRHARAVDHAPSGRDFDRRLAPAGHAQCARLHALFRRGELPWPGHVYCSPATRALETARAVLGTAASGIRQDARIYEARVSDLVEVLNPPATGTTLLVGHNPGLEGLVRWLTASAPQRGLKTATLVEIHTGADYAPGDGRLVRAIYADDLSSVSV